MAFSIFLGGKRAKVMLNGKQVMLAGATSGSVPDIPDIPDTPEVEVLGAPVIELAGDTLTMTATDERTEEFAIFVDGVEVTTVANEEIYRITLPSKLSSGMTTSFIIADTFTTDADDTVYNKIHVYEYTHSSTFMRADYRRVDDGFPVSAYYSSWDKQGYRYLTIKGFTETSDYEKQKLFNLASEIQGCVSFTFSGYASGKRFAPQGMTWRQYVNTPLNCDGLYIEGDRVVLIGASVDDVLPDDVITSTTYSTSYKSGSSN